MSNRSDPPALNLGQFLLEIAQRRDSDTYTCDSLVTELDSMDSDYVIDSEFKKAITCALGFVYNSLDETNRSHTS